MLNHYGDIGGDLPPIRSRLSCGHANDLLPSQLRVMWCIEYCRTEALGGHLYRCEACGEQVYSYPLVPQPALQSVSS